MPTDKSEIKFKLLTGPLAVEECMAFDGIEVDKKWLCKLCGYKASRKFEVKRHLTSVHAPSENIECPICGCCYKNKIVLKVHMRARHQK